MYCSGSRYLTHGLPVQFAFADETPTQQSEEHHDYHEGESLVSRPSVRVSDNLGSCGVESLDEIETLTHPLNNLIDIFVVMQTGSQSVPQKLLNDGRR